MGIPKSSPQGMGMTTPLWSPTTPQEVIKQIVNTNKALLGILNPSKRGEDKLNKFTKKARSQEEKGVRNRDFLYFIFELHRCVEALAMLLGFDGPEGLRVRPTDDDGGWFSGNEGDLCVTNAAVMVAVHTRDMLTFLSITDPEGLTDEGIFETVTRHVTYIERLIETFPEIQKKSK